MALRLAIKVAYFSINEFSHGFQIQPNVDTIFSFLQKALILTGFLKTDDQKIDYAGRTDHGVNAFCQVIAFNLAEKWLDVPERLLYRINVHLPNNIRCWSYAKVKNTFHPRYDALERNYTYVYSKTENKHLNLEEMVNSSKLLIGTHNFTNFSKKNEDSDHLLRTINNIIIQDEPDCVLISIHAKSFLWQQCRRIASHLLQIGENRVSIKHTSELLANFQSITRPNPLPPENLILTNILYNDLKFEDELGIKLKIKQSLFLDILESKSKINTLNLITKLFD